MPNIITHNKLREMSHHSRWNKIDGKPFYDIIHYFNNKNVEIGYVSFPSTIFETVRLFPDGRIWSEWFLEHSIIKEVIQ